MTVTTQPQVTVLPHAPDLAALARGDARRFPFLLTSVDGVDGDGAYDILFAEPSSEISLWQRDGQRWLQCDGRPLPGHTGFLDALDAAFLQQRRHYSRTHDLPFYGGWFVYLGYELAGEIEPTLALPVDARQPVAVAARVHGAIIRARGADARAFVVTEAGHAALHTRLLEAANSTIAPAPTPAWPRVRMTPAADAHFLASVRRALEYIAAGDIYQANLSRCWRAPMPAAAAVPLFEQLSRENPAPFAALVRLGDFALLSSSPERLLRIADGRVATRPIAGTRPRGASAAADAALREQLRSNAKEQAEHVMLIDLMRNDLGRICVPGSVVVDEYMVLETYAHVHHIVSNVCGELLAGTTPGAAIAAVFPGGTITGCPKVRCMQIIAELEAEPRGAYTGSLGYLNLDGSLDLNILIRTFTLAHGELSVRAGAGIVADSDPAAELAETAAKARGLILAAEGRDP